MKISIEEKNKTTEYILPDAVDSNALRKCIDILRTGATCFDIVDRRDHYAMKIWSDEDLKRCLKEDGFSDSDENVECVKNSGMLSALEDCTDQDWQIIHDTIQSCSGRLQIGYPSMSDMEKILRSTVSFMEYDCVDMEDAQNELEEMGFTEEQLKFFDFTGSEEWDFDRPEHFDDTVNLLDPVTGRKRKESTKEEAVYNMLLNIARWFRDDCMYEEDAREELKEIGFTDNLINAAWSL